MRVYSVCCALPVLADFEIAYMMLPVLVLLLLMLMLNVCYHRRTDSVFFSLCLSPFLLKIQMLQYDGTTHDHCRNVNGSFNISLFG